MPGFQPRVKILNIEKRIHGSYRLKCNFLFTFISSFDLLTFHRQIAAIIIFQIDLLGHVSTNCDSRSGN